MFPRLFLAALFLVLAVIAPLGSVAAPAPSPTITRVRGKVVVVKVPGGFKSIALWQKTGLKKVPLKILARRGTPLTGGNVTIALRQATALRSLQVTGERSSPDTAGAGRGVRLFLADPALVSSQGFAGSGGATPGVVSLDRAAVASLTLGSSSGATAARSVAESDIWQIAGDRLYFFNQLRGLQIFDIANPDQPALLGQLREANNGEQMYLLDPAHVVMLTRPGYFFAFSASAVSLPDRGSGSVLIADVTAGQPREIARVSYPGDLVESRLVGTALYVTSQVYQSGGVRLEVNSFDLSNPALPRQVDTLSLGSWGGVVHATDRFLFIVRQAANDWSRSAIEVIDISAPDGTLRRCATVQTGGVVNDKFKMHLAGDVLTTVSAVSGTPSRTRVEKFSLTDPLAPVTLGSLEIGVGETVRATRFADGRLYVVTFFTIDPLWVIDLAPAGAPILLGELEVPGFSTYLEPLGDRLVAIGHVGAQTAVSLFDVSDPRAPRLLSQLPLGDGYSYSEANWDEKALTVVPGQQLILVPYAGYDRGSGWATRVQLITLARDSLRLRGVVDQGFAVRRTAVVGNRILAISAGNLVTLDLGDRDQPRVTSNVEIAWRVDRVFLVGNHLVQIGGAVGGEPDAVPTITVAATTALDHALTVRDLAAVPVIGATVRGGRLYVAQQRSTSWWQDSPARIAGANGDASSNPLILSIFDVGNLPALPLLGRTEAEATPASYGYGGSDLEAAWPSDHTLVWVRPVWNSWWWGGPIFAFSDTVSLASATLPAGSAVLASGSGSLSLSGSDSSTAGRAIGGGALALVGPALPSGGQLSPAAGRVADLAVASSSARIWLPPWYRSSGGNELLVFDVADPQSPRLASQLSVRAGATGDWSRPIVSGGKLYLSAIAYDDPEPVAASALSRRYRHFLRRVDFTDPSIPVLSAEVNIPGRLLAVLDGGATLLTVGCGFDADGDPQPKRVFHTSHYDGTAAQLVEQLETRSAWDPYALDGATLLVGTYPQTSGLAGQLQAWLVGADGKFALADQIPAPPFSSFSTLHGLLVGFDGGLARVFEVNDPRRLVDRSDVDTSQLGSGSFDRAAGGAGLGIWQPLGDSGVGVVSVAP